MLHIVRKQESTLTPGKCHVSSGYGTRSKREPRKRYALLEDWVVRIIVGTTGIEQFLD